MQSESLHFFGAVDGGNYCEVVLIKPISDVSSTIIHVHIFVATHQSHNLPGNAHTPQSLYCFRRSHREGSPAKAQRTWTKCTREQARRLPVGGKRASPYSLYQRRNLK